MNLQISMIRTFDDVLDRLDIIIYEAIQKKDRIGYFASLYRTVTYIVKEAAINGHFEKPNLIENLDVGFAIRYFNAIDSFDSTNLESKNPWHQVFILGRNKMTIVQHLLLSANVHINLDLPIVLAQIHGEAILSICDDFFKMSSLFTLAMKEVEKDLSALSPIISKAARSMPKFETKVLDFSLNTSRSKSWECACKQVVADEFQKEKIIQLAHQGVQNINRRIVSPGPFANPFLWFAAIFEQLPIHETIKILTEQSESMAKRRSTR